MRVAMLGWEFPPFVSGGLGVHCYELTRKLAERGVSIDFYMPHARERPQPPHPNIKIVEVGTTYINPYSGMKTKLRETYGYSLLEAVSSYNKACIEAVLSCVRGGARYNPIHNHDWLTVQAAADLKKRLGLQLVFTLHSTEYDRAQWPWERLLAFEREGILQADRVITVSNRMRKRLLSMGAQEGKVRVIYNAVNGDLFEKYDPYSQRNTKVVLFLGRMAEQKGPMQFLLAAKKVSERMPNVKFVMAGTGSLLPQLISKSIE
ncbi:MAG: glycosyltransferase family 4 protein, partial [Candidatus Aenigmarchaeota archaeon]|nr:glycosyltransferase family 4 protein [Candidatus Aenigmarchaeota archaeon]